MRRQVIALVVAVAGLAAVGEAVATPSGPALPQGCAPSRPAVAHYAGGVVLRHQPAGRPVPCGVSTGYAGAESHIVATPSGSVFFTPAVVPAGLVGTNTAPVPVGNTWQSNASPAGLAATSDGGTRWRLIKPSGTTWNPTDHGDYVDPATGRLFFEDYGPIPLNPAFTASQEGPAHINWSADNGHTWHHTSIDTVVLPENPRFTSARPPAHQPKPTGYPDVLYFCANTNVGVTSPVIAGRLCFDSLDGGQTWTQRSVLLTGSVPQHKECGTHGETYSAIDGYYPQPARDGSLYVMVACGGTTFLAHSTDEAKSFPVIHRSNGKPLVLPLSAPGAGLSLGESDLRIGADDTMYLTWSQSTANSTHLFLRVSRTYGRSWSKPLDVTAPGVATVGHWAMAVRGQTVAVAYLGQRHGQTTFDGYITTTRTAAAVLRGGRPVFFSGVVNDPKRPLLYGSGIQGAGYIATAGPVNVPLPPPFDNHSTGNDFIGATIDFSGNPWGSFTQDCGPSPSAETCVAQQDQTRGFAGHLTW